MSYFLSLPFLFCMQGNLRKVVAMLQVLIKLIGLSLLIERRLKTLKMKLNNVSCTLFSKIIQVKNTFLQYDSYQYFQRIFLVVKMDNTGLEYGFSMTLVMLQNPSIFVDTQTVPPYQTRVIYNKQHLIRSWLGFQLVSICSLHHHWNLLKHY